MPILDISVVLKHGETLPESTAQTLADEAGRIFASEAATTWVRLWPIAQSCYAENETEEKNTANPVFVEILKIEDEPEEKRKEECSEIASTFSRLMNRPTENVHIIYLPRAKGRIAFGGKTSASARK